MQNRWNFLKTGFYEGISNWLYSLLGLTATYAALRRDGVLAIWSAGSQPPFVRRLRRAGFEVDEVKVRARGGSSRKGEVHIMSSGLPRAVDGGQR